MIRYANSEIDSILSIHREYLDKNPTEAEYETIKKETAEVYKNMGIKREPEDEDFDFEGIHKTEEAREKDFLVELDIDQEYYYKNIEIVRASGKLIHDGKFFDSLDSSVLDEYKNLEYLNSIKEDEKEEYIIKRLGSLTKHTPVDE